MQLCINDNVKRKLLWHTISYLLPLRLQAQNVNTLNNVMFHFTAAAAKDILRFSPNHKLNLRKKATAKGNFNVVNKNSF